MSTLIHGQITEFNYTCKNQADRSVHPHPIVELVVGLHDGGPAGGLAAVDNLERIAVPHAHHRRRPLVRAHSDGRRRELHRRRRGHELRRGGAAADAKPTEKQPAGRQRVSTRQSSVAELQVEVATNQAKE